MGIVKKCRHGKGLIGRARQTAWAKCGCAWYGDITQGGIRSYVPLGADRARATTHWRRLVSAADAGETVIVRASAYGDTLAEVAARWIEAIPGTVTDSTLTAYGHVVRSGMPGIRDMRVSEIRTADLANMAAEMRRSGKSASTINGAMSVVSLTLAHARNEGLLRERPTLPKRQRVKKVEPPSLAPADVERIIAALDSRYRQITRLTWLLGLRAGEALALPWEEVYFDRREIRVVQNLERHSGLISEPKGGLARSVHLPTAANRCFPAERGAGLIWPDLRYWSWLKDWHKALDVCGLLTSAAFAAKGRRGIHVLRHSNVALRIASGQTIVYISRQLGHAKPSFTLDVYGAWFPSERSESALIDDQLAPQKRRDS